MVDRAFAQPYADAGELSIWPGYEGQIPLSAVYRKKRQADPPIAAFLAAVASVFHDQAVAT